MSLTHLKLQVCKFNKYKCMLEKQFITLYHSIDYQMSFPHQNFILHLTIFKEQTYLRWCQSLLCQLEYLFLNIFRCQFQPLKSTKYQDEIIFIICKLQLLQNLLLILLFGYFFVNEYTDIKANLPYYLSHDADQQNVF